VGFQRAMTPNLSVNLKKEILTKQLHMKQYTAPITYRSHQIKGHVYKIILTDTDWNSPDASLPTENAEFAASVNNVGTHQIQHGASNIDRSDVPQLSNLAFLYGQAQ